MVRVRARGLGLGSRSCTAGSGVDGGPSVPPPPPPPSPPPPSPPPPLLPPLPPTLVAMTPLPLLASVAARPVGSESWRGTKPLPRCGGLVPGGSPGGVEGCLGSSRSGLGARRLSALVGPSSSRRRRSSSCFSACLLSASRCPHRHASAAARTLWVGLGLGVGLGVGVGVGLGLGSGLGLGLA